MISKCLHDSRNKRYNGHMSTAHYMTQDNYQRENRDMCGDLRHDPTRQKSGLVMSDLTMLDICNKAGFLSCHIVS